MEVAQMALTGSITFPPGLMTSDQVAERIGVPYRSLMHWVEGELVQPFSSGNHKRAARLWSERHIREARWIHVLRAEGVSVEAVKKAMDFLRENDGDNPQITGLFLVMDRAADVVRVCHGSQEMSCLRQPGHRLLLCVDLGADP